MRAWRKLLLIFTASLWLAMSTHAQIHLTAMLAANTSIENHPALETAPSGDALVAEGDNGNWVVIDAALFWDAVDQFSAGNDTQLACPLHLPGMPSAAKGDFGTVAGAVLNDIVTPTYVTRSFAPDTPPPRI